MYENVVACQELPLSAVQTNASMASGNYAAMSSHVPKQFPSGTDFNATYCNINKSGHFHQMSGSLSSNSLSRYDVGDCTPNQYKQRVPLPSRVSSNYSNCSSSIHTEEDRDTSPIFRTSSATGLKPRSNTAPSRRRPLLGNALSRGPGDNTVHQLQTQQTASSVQCSCESISCNAQSHFGHLSGAADNLNRLVASHSPQTSSLPGSPKILPRRTSLPGSWKSERSGAPRNNSKCGGSGGTSSSTGVQFCPSCAQIAQTLPTGWEVKETGEGLPYFIDHNTRSTHWRLPWLPICLPCELLQKAYLENSAEVARDAMMFEEDARMGPSLEMMAPNSMGVEYPAPSGGAKVTVPVVPPRQAVLPSKLSTTRVVPPSVTMDSNRQQQRMEQQHLHNLPSPPVRTLQERLSCDSRELPGGQQRRTVVSNYLGTPVEKLPTFFHQSLCTSNASDFTQAYINQTATSPYEIGDSARLYDSIFDDNYVKINRELKPLKPLTRLPNALPLDVALAAERSRRVIDTYKPEMTSPGSPPAPNRPEHPSVESQLVYLLNAQPDFFMDAYYKGDEKLDRMIDFKLFDCGQLEVMRDSMDKLYFAECQSTCAAYERYRLALTEKIKHKLGLQLKEKHKRQLSHIRRNCAANAPSSSANTSSASSSNETLDNCSQEDSMLETTQNSSFQQNESHTAPASSLSSLISRVQLSDSC